MVDGMTGTIVRDESTDHAGDDGAEDSDHGSLAVVTSTPEEPSGRERVMTAIIVMVLYLVLAGFASTLAVVPAMLATRAATGSWGVEISMTTGRSSSTTIDDALMAPLIAFTAGMTPVLGLLVLRVRRVREMISADGGLSSDPRELPDHVHGRSPVRAWARVITIGVLIAIAVIAVIQGAAALIQLAGGDLSSSSTSSESMVSAILVGAPWVKALTIMGTVILAPITEELVFRGVIARSFARWRRSDGSLTRDSRSGVAWSSLWSGLCFAVMHAVGVIPGSPLVILTTLVSVLLLGVILSWVSTRTDSLIPGMIIHMAFNGLQVVLAVVAA